MLMIFQSGVTALVAASRSGHLDIVKVLLAAGAEKEAKNRVGGYLDRV